MAIDPRTLSQITDVPQKERDRTVRQPGQRGGTYRKIWSPKLKKFYVKYGRPESSMSVKNPDDDRQSGDFDPKTRNSLEAIKTPPVQPQRKETDDILRGIFEILLQNMQVGPSGTGKTRHGRPVSFKNVTPIVGEMIPIEEGQIRFVAYDEDGDIVQEMVRATQSEKERREFMAFMVAEYVTYQYISQKYHKSFTLLVDYHKMPVVDELKKSLILAKIETRVSLKPLDIHIPERTLLKKSLEALQSTIADVFSGESIEELEPLEKAGDKDIWMRNAPVAGRKYGHVGSGNRAVFRKPGRPPGTGSGLTIASAGIARSGIKGIEQMENSISAIPAPSGIKVSNEPWHENPDMKPNAMVLVHHPYKHKQPVWGRVVSVGDHGAVVDCKGDHCNVRWQHIHKLLPRVENTPENVFELASMLPMADTTKIDFRDEAEAEKMLRKLGMRFAADLIHRDHESHDDALSALINMETPLDFIESTRVRSSNKDNRAMEHLKDELINAAISQDLPININILKKLRLKDAVEVLHSYLSTEKAEP